MIILMVICATLLDYCGATFHPPSLPSCRNGMFGINCYGRCHCADKTGFNRGCSPYTGQCHRKKCEPNFIDWNNITACQVEAVNSDRLSYTYLPMESLSAVDKSLIEDGLNGTCTEIEHSDLPITVIGIPAKRWVVYYIYQNSEPSKATITDGQTSQQLSVASFQSPLKLIATFAEKITFEYTKEIASGRPSISLCNTHLWMHTADRTSGSFGIHGTFKCNCKNSLECSLETHRSYCSSGCVHHSLRLPHCQGQWPTLRALPTFNGVKTTENGQHAMIKFRTWSFEHDVGETTPTYYIIKYFEYGMGNRTTTTRFHRVLHAEEKFVKEVEIKVSVNTAYELFIEVHDLFVNSSIRVNGTFPRQDHTERTGSIWFEVGSSSVTLPSSTASKTGETIRTSTSKDVIESKVAVTSLPPVIEQTASTTNHVREGVVASRNRAPKRDRSPIFYIIVVFMGIFSIVLMIGIVLAFKQYIQNKQAIVCVVMDAGATEDNPDDIVFISAGTCEELVKNTSKENMNNKLTDNESSKNKATVDSEDECGRQQVKNGSVRKTYQEATTKQSEHLLAKEEKANVHDVKETTLESTCMPEEQKMFVEMQSFEDSAAPEDMLKESGVIAKSWENGLAPNSTDERSSLKQNNLYDYPEEQNTGDKNPDHFKSCGENSNPPNSEDTFGEIKCAAETVNGHIPSQEPTEQFVQDRAGKDGTSDGAKVPETTGTGTTEVVTKKGRKSSVDHDAEASYSHKNDKQTIGPNLKKAESSKPAEPKGNRPNVQTKERANILIEAGKKGAKPAKSDDKLISTSNNRLEVARKALLKKRTEQTNSRYKKN